MWVRLGDVALILQHGIKKNPSTTTLSYTSTLKVLDEIVVGGNV